MDSFTGITAVTHSSQMSVRFSAHLGIDSPSLKYEVLLQTPCKIGAVGEVS